jgi:hypothetical protein
MKQRKIMNIKAGRIMLLCIMFFSILFSFLAGQSQNGSYTRINYNTIMKQQKTLFSEVKGKVLLNGQPLAGLEIIQRFSWFGVDDASRTTTTDSSGFYSFPAILSAKKQPRKEKDIFIWQTIETTYNEKEVVLWQTTKYNFQDNGELGGRPIVLNHELSQESRNIMIPTFGGYRTNLDGVVTPQHPYVQGLDSGTNKIMAFKEALTQQFLSKLNSSEVLALFNEKFVFEPFQTDLIEKVIRVSETEFSSFSLHKDANCNSESLDQNSYFGFTINAVTEFQTSGDRMYSANVYWSNACIQLLDSINVIPVLEGNSLSIQLDLRQFFNLKVLESIQKDKLNDLVYRLITTQPEEGLTYTLDLNLSLDDLIYDDKPLPRSYKHNFTVDMLKLTDFSVLYVNKELQYATILCDGLLNVAGHQTTYNLSAYFCLSLRMNENNEYENVLNENCTCQIGVETLSFNIRFEKTEFRPDEPLTMYFSVTNLLPKKNIFLIWHTPFEGFRNEFLHITHLPSGEQIPYEGMLVSRLPPSKERGSYIELAPGETKTSTIDLREAYTFTKKGKYRVSFYEFGRKGMNEYAIAEFTLN